MTRGLMPWNVSTPRVLEEFRQDIDQLFQRFFAPENGGERSLMFTPRIDLSESEREYEITVDLPGMKAEDFNVEWKDRDLWITGERSIEMEEHGRTYHRTERQHGRFRRVVSLDMPVEAEKIDAEYKDGVLRLRVPKSEVALPRKIEVKS